MPSAHLGIAQDVGALGLVVNVVLQATSFILPEKVARGELRSLRDPANASDDEADSKFRFPCYRTSVERLRLALSGPLHR